MRTPGPNGRGPGDRTGRSITGGALAALLLLSSAILASGQSGPPRRVGGITAGGLFPTGDFKRHIDKIAWGASVFSGWRIGHAPVLYGFEIAGHFYGVSLFSSRDDSYNTVVQALSFLRLQPRTGSVITYVEVLAGFNYLSTETYYTVNFLDDTVTEIEDVTVAAGAGAGLCIRLRQGDMIPDRERHPAYLEFKVRYMAGGHADYLRELGDGSLVPEHSATSFITASVGLSWFF
jgi:hypothetical protein